MCIMVSDSLLVEFSAQQQITFVIILVKYNKLRVFLGHGL